MASRAKPKQTATRARRPSQTRADLIAAAAHAFNTDGYHGTDTNKIARAAGYAPQTFYRHFRDKIDVFVAVYERWQAEERAAIAEASSATSAEDAIVKAVLSHHASWKTFRRSLRWLAIENDVARSARTESRARQLDDLARLDSNAGRPRAELLAALLAIERLCDAAADGELEDSGLSEGDISEVVRMAVRRCRG
jgi:AcrR family transcriptional regulator